LHAEENGEMMKLRLSSKELGPLLPNRLAKGNTQLLTQNTRPVMKMRPPMILPQTPQAGHEGKHASSSIHQLRNDAISFVNFFQPAVTRSSLLSVNFYEKSEVISPHNS